MGEERRRFRQARRAERTHRRFVVRPMLAKEDQDLGGAGRKSGQVVAQRAALIGMAAMEMDELAELVDVLERMLERRLPAGE